MAAYKTLRRFCVRSYNQPPCILTLEIERYRLGFLFKKKFLTTLRFTIFIILLFIGLFGELSMSDGVFGWAAADRFKMHPPY